MTMTRKEISHRYYISHLEQIRGHSNRWAIANPAKATALRKRWRATHIEDWAVYKASQRCNNPRDASYIDYGGRGIRCLIKSGDEVIGNIGRRPSKDYSLDRIDNDGNYEVGNIRWATRKQQQNNRRNTKCPK